MSYCGDEGEGGNGLKGLLIISDCIRNGIRRGRGRKGSWIKLRGERESERE